MLESVLSFGADTRYLAVSTVITLTGDIHQSGHQPEAMDSVFMLVPTLAQVEAGIIFGNKVF